MSYEYLGSTSIPTQGVDWITVTHPGKQDIWDDIYEVRMALDPESKWSFEQWAFFGYEGASYGKFSCGLRGVEGLMQFRGNLATEALALIPPGWKATRIDLQCSVLLEEVTSVAERYFRSLGGSSRISRPMLRFMSSSNDGGDTLYIGSRKSKQMGRIYDKGAESQIGADSELPSGLFWRYEVELKGDKAVGVYDALKRLGGDYGAVIATYVYDWFISRGITPAFDREGVDLVVNAAVMAATDKDDANKKLAWIVRCVTPVVQQLRAEFTDYTILEALNMIEKPHIDDVQ